MPAVGDCAAESSAAQSPIPRGSVMRLPAKWHAPAEATTGSTAPLTTHHITYSDRLKVFLSPGETVGGYLRPLIRFDGRHHYSLRMTRLATPVRSSDLGPANGYSTGRDTLLCVGSSEALAIELRTTDGGIPGRFTVGLPGVRVGAPNLDVPVPADVRSPAIYPDELFTAAQAVAIFRTYFETGDVPRWLQLRATSL